MGDPFIIIQNHPKSVVINQKRMVGVTHSFGSHYLDMIFALKCIVGKLGNGIWHPDLRHGVGHHYSPVEVMICILLVSIYGFSPSPTRKYSLELRFSLL